MEKPRLALIAGAAIGYALAIEDVQKPNGGGEPRRASWRSVRPPGSPRFLSGQWIAPPDTGEAGKIGIRGDDLAAVFERQRSQVCVGDKICRSLARAEHVLKDRPMSFGRIHDPRAWLIQPALDAGDRVIEGEGLLENARVGADADEGSQDSPAQAHRGTP